MQNTLHKPAGAPASNQYGQFKVKTATPNQQAFIKRLLAERKHELGELDPATVSLKEAEDVIRTLLQSPKTVDRSRVASPKQASFILSLADQKPRGREFLELAFMENRVNSVEELPAQIASELINRLMAIQSAPRAVIVDVGAYLYNGIVYSVRKARESGKLHAYHWNADAKSWTYAGNIKYDLRPEHRLTFEQASEFGATTGTCVYCNRTLTDADSVRWGMGSTCRKRYH